MMTSEIENRVIALAASPAFGSDGTCFAASDQGLFKTVDRGETWSSCFAGMAQLEQVLTTAVAVSPAFAHDGTVLTAIPGGIGRSTDRGLTWQFARLPLPQPVVTSFALSPDFANDRLAFFGSMLDGVFRSEDGGQTWTAWNSGLFDRSVLAMAVSPNFSSDQTLFAGSSSGVYRGTNRGRAWHPVDVPCERHTILSLAVMAAGTDGYRILAGTEAHGLWISSNSGGTWRQVDRDVAGGTIHMIASATGDSGDDHTIVLGDDALMCSADGGMAWHAVEGMPGQTEDIAELIITSAGPKVLVRTVDGRIHPIPMPVMNDNGPR
ncbi:MAG: hypothetical protein H0V37_03195 [Chloroflexia bacterium]|nr:hypothetical protein [Chloroflexia bacterium]